ncbi:hypothetical protein [Promicromonospora sp. NPDC019610]|uniref:hypothetical protein n=1 Tax=Promicromonospora sp. NPDC019610 TaxID=3364405 RepID=UPI00379EC746
MASTPWRDGVPRALAATMAGEAAISTSLVTKEAELKALDVRLADAPVPIEAVDLNRLTKNLEIVGGSLKVLNHATDKERRDHSAFGSTPQRRGSVSTCRPWSRQRKSVRRGTWQVPSRPHLIARAA